MNWGKTTCRRWLLPLVQVSIASSLSIQAAQVTSFQAGTGGWQLGTLVVGNIDNDSQLEIVVPYRSALTGTWQLDAFKINGQRVVGFPYQSLTDPINVTPTLSDLVGDARKEIVFTAGANIVVLKGDGSVLWSRPVHSANYIPDAGFMAVTNGFYMTPAGLFQPTLSPSARFYSEVSSPLVFDTDHDGQKEIITAWKISPDSVAGTQDYNPFVNDYFGAGEWGATGEVWSGGVLFHHATTGAPQFTYHFHQLVEAGLAVGRVQAGNSYNVFVLNDADSVVPFDRTENPGFMGAGMLHGKFGKNLRLLSGTYQRGVDLTIADLDGDGRSEVLVASSQIDPNWQPNETILDDDGAILWRRWLRAISSQHQHGWYNNAVLIPVNPDRDNQVDVLGFTHTGEITFRSWNGTQLVDRPGWPKNFGAFIPTPPVVGDLDGNNDEEIVIGTYDPARNPSSGTLYVYALNGTQKAAIPVPGGLKHIPTIADVDRDGKNDLVYRGLDGKIYIQNFGAGSPALVSWATHLGNEAHDGNFGKSLFPDGTPIIQSSKAEGRSLTFSWSIPPGKNASNFTIQKSAMPEGPFTSIATVDGSVRTYTDIGDLITLGHLYFYRVAANYAGSSLFSSHFPILAQAPGNLIVNGGFELDDDSHWDKWFTGDIPWQNMVASTNHPHNGKASMEIKLNNHGNNSTITQYSHYGVQKDYLPVNPGTLYSFGGWVRTLGMSGPSEHWLEWDSSRTGEHPEVRPLLPWPNYFTPHFQAASSSEWTYLNRTFLMPAGFPNVELRHRYRVPEQTTGSVFLDDLFFREIPLQSDPRWRDLVPFKSRWRFTTTPQPTNWFTPGFDDDDWSEGAAKFGAGTGPSGIATAVTPRQPNYFFRKKFVLPFTPGVLKELLLAATCTDDYGGKTYPFELYLNGRSIPAPDIEAVTGEGNIVKYFDLFPFTSYLVEGTNSIAVKLNNTWQPSWDNVAFDLTLRTMEGEASVPVRARITTARVQADGSVLLTIAGAVGTNWELQSSDGHVNSWRTVQSLTLGSNPANLTDSGQAGRPHPATIPVRYYRLVQR